MKLEKLKSDDSFENAAIELTESIIFDKLYMHFYLNISQFNKDEEALLKQKLKNNQEINFEELKIDKIYGEFKFEVAIREIKKISTVTTHFEKLKFLNNTVRAFEKEAKEVFNKHGKSDLKFSSDELVPIFQVIISKAEINNVLTESIIMQFFNIKPSILNTENDYLLTTFITAVTQLKQNYLDGVIKNCMLAPVVITTSGTSFSQSQDLDFAYANRSQSVYFKGDTGFASRDDDTKSVSGFKSVKASLFS